MSEERPKKRYIRRKRALKECIKLLLETLREINPNGNSITGSDTIQESAEEIASYIEASCWSPRLNMSDGEYMQLIMKKTEKTINILKSTNGLNCGLPQGICQGVNGFAAEYPVGDVYKSFNSSLDFEDNKAPLYSSNSSPNVVAPQLGGSFNCPVFDNDNFLSEQNDDDI